MSGYGLMGNAAMVRQQGMEGLKVAAREEAERNVANKQNAREEKMQATTAGATVGALAGAEIGSAYPVVGTLIGAAIGGLIGYAAG